MLNTLAPATGAGSRRPRRIMRQRQFLLLRARLYLYYVAKKRSKRASSLLPIQLLHHPSVKGEREIQMASAAHSSFCPVPCSPIIVNNDARAGPWREKRFYQSVTSVCVCVFGIHLHTRCTSAVFDYDVHPAGIRRLYTQPKMLGWKLGEIQ